MEGNGTNTYLQEQYSVRRLGLISQMKELLKGQQEIKVCEPQGPGFLLDDGSPSPSCALRFCDENVQLKSHPVFNNKCSFVNQLIMCCILKTTHSHINHIKNLIFTTGVFK